MDKRYFSLSILTTMIVSISFLGCDHKDETNESMTVDSKMPESSPSAEEPSLASESVSPPDKQEEIKPKTIPAGNKVIITGQLVKKDGSPFPSGHVTVHESKDGNAVFEVGEGGTWLNPGCKVDNEGRFTLELDLDVFEGIEEFTLLAILNPNLPKLSPLRDRNGAIITFTLSEHVKTADLGEIVVE